jgi:hypothetical protein
MKQLNSIIDGLPGHPSFQCQDLFFGNERLQFHFRDVLECICAIYGDPKFMQDLIFTPERHYVDNEQTQQVYSEMNTGDWWWSIQVHHMKSFGFLY